MKAAMMHRLNKKYILTALLIFLTAAVFAQNKPAKEKPAKEQPAYTIEQAVSDNAQLNTIAFSGLAFITGTFGADTFLPPGKVADYFGFQYMRDIDANGFGHNMNFLTRIANNILGILSEDQLELLKNLAAEQEGQYRDLAMMRLSLIKGFRTALEQNLELSEASAAGAVAEIFELDGLLSYRRAEVFGQISVSLGDEQKKAISALKFGDFTSWSDVPEKLDKRSLPHEQNVLVMTYASEFFSWYAGSEYSDVYFCPERHGTYFGGFYMKDYPSIGNADYYIPIELTGNSGQSFLEIIGSESAALLNRIVNDQKTALEEIIEIRTQISRELRKALTGKSIDHEYVLALSRRYGELDGWMSWNYAQAFIRIKHSLDSSGLKELVILRNQTVFPDGVYIYADRIAEPEISIPAGLIIR